jgi:hypothetical protein
MKRFLVVAAALLSIVENHRNQTGPEKSAGAMMRASRRGAETRAVWRALFLTATAMAAILAHGEAARAACDPPAGSNVTATCTGTTVDQNAPNGYGTGGETNLNVTVVSGASVAGFLNGIAFDTGTVTNFGTIGGDFGSGIIAVTTTVTNTGTITGGIAGNGVAASNTANVTNSGAISGSFDGIVAATANVTNSGTISGGGHGIFASTATVINSGTISGGNDGIFASTATVTNSGTITGGDIGIIAIIATVTNSGAISGGDIGIIASTTNVANSGSISGGTTGVFASTNANVTNSGSIFGGVAALQFAGNPDTLTLLPGSHIVGAILLGGGGDTVNVRTGNQNLTFDTLAGATVTSTLPFVVVGNRIVTIDPTPFAMTDRSLMDFTRGVAAAIPEVNVAAGGGAPLAFAATDSSVDRVGDAFAAVSGLAYAGEANVFKSPTAVHADGTAIWARGFLGRRVQDADGVLLRTTNQFYGGMLGADRQVSSTLRLGIFGGGGETHSDLAGNAGETTSTLVFGGAFARWRWANTFLNVAVQAGHSDTDTSRQINNNLAPGGIETAKAKFDGWYVNPEASVGVDYVLGTMGGALYTLTPSARLSYLYADYDGYTEIGSTANLTVGGRSLHNLEERGQLKLTRTQTFGTAAVISTSVYGGVLAVQRIGDTTINASLLGQLLPFATPGDDNVWGGYGGAGLTWQTAQGISFFGAIDYTALSDDSSIVAGQVGLRVVW